ncbi:MAG: META domain-containing protein [Ferruginibacter sp.]
MKKIIAILCLPLLLLACNGSQKTTADSNKAVQKINEKSNTEQVQSLLVAGVDFMAQGSQPSNWMLTINYDDTVRFNADDGLSLKFACNQLQKDVNKERSFYTVKLKSGGVKISIYKKICTVPTMGAVVKKEVNVHFNSTIYEGCGNFLADTKLENKWLLEKIGNSPIVAAAYNKIPEMNFNIVNGTVKGSDGCNSFSGKIEVQGKRIQFSALVGTRLVCNKKSIQNILSGQINEQLVSYYLKDEKLYLYLLDDSILVFKKAN